MSTSPSMPSHHPPPHEYNSIIHSIQRRSADRGLSRSEDLNTAWRPESSVLYHDLEADLRLSAQVGVALLQEKGELERKVATVEGANQKLLDRLTASVRETSQVQRRLEEAVGNLEQAESNNRALLIALEEDRKKVSRLVADAARHTTTASQLKANTRALEDAQQELQSERRRANQAETKQKKVQDRMGEMEGRLSKAILDLEEMRQDKVLRSRKSYDALAKVRARVQTDLNAKADALGAAVINNPETVELLTLVESLISENEMLKSESLELHELLDVARDEQSGLRSQIAEVTGFVEEDEDHMGRELSNPTLDSEAILTSSVSHAFSDFDQLSPASTHPTSFTRSWGPSSNLSGRSRVPELNRTLSSPTASTYEDASRVVPRRRGSAVASVSTKIPIGRGHNRRAMSVDVNSYRKSQSETADSAPNSPQATSPPTRPPSIISTDDGESIRPRRHHRPLSLTLGPSLFPLVPEDADYDPYAPRPYRRHSYRISTASLPLSTAGEGSLASAASGLSFTSPKRPKRMRRETSEPPLIVTIDSGTQTTPHSSPSRKQSASTPTRSRHGYPSVSPLRASLGISTPPPSSSDLSEGEHNLAEFGLAPGTHDTRTAALSVLIEHTSKLLARIQSADIVTQEKRLKKQHLSGDVRHLAQANLRDLVADIDGLRTHFRRVLEHERTINAKDASAGPADSDSLVVRRDFVSLVKLFRDLLFETSRLRSLINRVEVDPSLASSLRELDVLKSIETVRTTKPSSGLLAPISRLFSSALASEPESALASPLPPPPSSGPTLRPMAKRSGSSAVSSTTVNVEFGAGAVRQAVAVGMVHGDLASPDRSSEPPKAGTIGRKKSETQVKRDLSSIFAGGLPAPKSDPWVVVPNSKPTASMNPFGRLLAAAYRPSSHSTANAVIDSLPHAPQVKENAEPTLLERQLRPRGLSDSSIRSTFVAHANPHHRVISPATLALSSEAKPSVPTPIISIAPGAEAGQPTLKAQLSELSTSLSRKSSSARLRTRPSSGQLRSVSTPIPTEPVPPVPALPISISLSPHDSSKGVDSESTSQSQSLEPGTSLFGNLSTWATKSFSPLPNLGTAEEFAKSPPKRGEGSDPGPASVGERAGRNLV